MEALEVMKTTGQFETYASVKTVAKGFFDAAVLSSNVACLVSLSKMEEPLNWAAASLAAASIACVVVEFVLLLLLYSMSIQWQTADDGSLRISFWQRILNSATVCGAGLILMINIALSVVTSAAYA